MSPVARFFVGCIGFIIGVVGTTFLLEVFNPRSAAWAILLPVVGVWFFRVFYHYETIQVRKFLSTDSKLDRLKLTLCGLWILGSIMYINENRAFRRLDIFDINDWGYIESEAARIVLLPTLFIFVGFPLLQKLINWIKSGK